MTRAGRYEHETEEERALRLMLQAARLQCRRESDPEVNKKTKNWREENPDSVKKSTQKWIRNHGRAWRAKTYQKNREKIIAKNAKWAAANPEKVAQIKSRRRAHKLGTRASESCQRWQAIYLIARFLRDHDHSAVVDHIIPLSRGGADSWDNLQILTARENDRKWAHVDYVVTPSERFLTPRDILE